MFPLALLNKSNSTTPVTVLDLQFTGANGSTIIDTTGRHTPSLSPSGTRSILNNQLNLASAGFIRADAQAATSTDFDFTGRDFKIECKVTYTSGTYVWIHTANDNNLGLHLRFAGSNTLWVRSGTSQLIMEYIAPTSFVGRQVKISVSLTGTNYSLKVDDVPVGSFNAFPITDIGTNGFIIGSYPLSSGMTGLIDDFKVWVA